MAHKKEKEKKKETKGKRKNKRALNFQQTLHQSRIDPDFMPSRRAINQAIDYSSNLKSPQLSDKLAECQRTILGMPKRFESGDRRLARDFPKFPSLAETRQAAIIATIHRVYASETCFSSRSVPLPLPLPLLISPSRRGIILPKHISASEVNEPKESDVSVVVGMHRAL